jgi:1-acyl-sn-glycerol-3-phosphate acyltransferase
LRKKDCIAPIFRKFIKKYHRLEVKGTENIPDGSAIIAPNHSGAMDWDTVCLSCALDRWIHILYWDRYYNAPIWGDFIRNFNVIPLSLERGLDEEMRGLLLEEYFRKGKLVGIFPEGTSATLFEGYRIGKFYPGVIRLAEFSGAPIIPTAIVGIAEAAPILFYTAVDEKGIRDPPFAPPLLFPVKIKIRFGEPIFWRSEKKMDRNEYYKAAEEIRREVVKLVQKTRK